MVFTYFLDITRIIIFLVFVSTFFLYFRKKHTFKRFVLGLVFSFTSAFAVFLTCALIEDIVVPSEELTVRAIRKKNNEHAKQLAQWERELNSRDYTLDIKENEIKAKMDSLAEMEKELDREIAIVRAQTAKPTSSSSSTTLIGKWRINQDGINYIVTIYESSSSYYSIVDYGESQTTRESLRRSGNYFYVIGSSTGDYYQIKENSKLLIGDKDGIINTHTILIG